MSSEIPDPRQIPATTKPADIERVTDSEMEEAARSLGLIRMAPRTIKALQKVGRYIEENGICYVQATEVMRTRSQLEDLYDRCLSVADTIDDPQVKVEAMKAAILVAKEKNVSNQMIAKMLESKLIGPTKPARRHQGLAPGQSVGIAQVNINRPESVEINEGQ